MQQVFLTDFICSREKNLICPMQRSVDLVNNKHLKAIESLRGLLF